MRRSKKARLSLRRDIPELPLGKRWGIKRYCRLPRRGSFKLCVFAATSSGVLGQVAWARRRGVGLGGFVYPSEVYSAGKTARFAQAVDEEWGDLDFVAKKSPGVATDMTACGQGDGFAIGTGRHQCMCGGRGLVRHQAGDSKRIS